MKALDLLSLSKLRWWLICFFPCFWGDAPVKYKPFMKSIVLPSKTHWTHRQKRGSWHHSRRVDWSLAWNLKSNNVMGTTHCGWLCQLPSVFDLHVVQLVQCFRLVWSYILPRSWGYDNRSIFIKSLALGRPLWLCPPSLAFPSSTLTTITHTLLWIHFCFAPTSMGLMFQTL